VSKLCCPICWELMEILKGHSVTQDQYNVRGRHSTFYPVQLPPYFDHDVVLELADRFEAHLKKELQSMRINNVSSRNTHRRLLSYESDSGLSTASFENDDLSDIEVDALE
jgi:hypothetical protein